MQFQLYDFLREAAQRNVSGVYIIPGSPLSILENGRTYQIGERLMPADTEQLIREAYTIAQRETDEKLFSHGDDNFSFTLPGVSRFRISMFRQRNSYGCVIRLIRFNLPDPQELHIPAEVINAANLEDGLVLTCGVSGSGITTTLASIIQEINRTRQGKLIITLEKPLEYLHSHDKCLVMQREISTDTDDYISGLDAVQYQRPNVLLLSDMPTPEIVQKTIRIAQTGRLVLTTAFGSSTANAIRSLVDMFSPDQQPSICAQLANTLRLLIYQRMVTDVSGSLIPVFETVYLDDMLRGMLRANDITSFEQTIAHSKTSGIIPFDRSLITMYRQQKITRETASSQAINKAMVNRQIF